MTTTISFQIDGEFITELARTWFWDEHKPLETCAELIKTCCPNVDEVTQNEIVQNILEGRKKFVGIDEFTLEDDNEHIRTFI